jgi:hypothetical protein
MSVETLKARAAERRATDDRAVLTAARTIAAGGTVGDVVALEAAMAGAGVTVDQFDKLVALCRNRAADRALLAAVPAAETKVVKLTSVIDKAVAERQKAIDTAHELLTRLEADRGAAEAVIREGTAARERLLRSAPGAVGAALEAARQAHRDAVVARDNLRQTVTTERQTAARYTAAADASERVGDCHPADIDSRRRAARRAEHAAAEAEAGIPPAEAAVAAALATLRSSEADALEV